MAAILTHYLIAKDYIEKFKNYEVDDEIAFLVGAIAADTPNSLGKGFGEREASHFGSSPSMALLEKGKFSLDGDVLDYSDFIDKYKDQLNSPFIEGYLLHLYTDKKWFEEVITHLLNIHANEINERAKNASDLTFKEAISWYTKSLYETYNAHDILFKPYISMEQIQKMREFNSKKCPIDIINKDDLKQMLNNLSVKCENLNSESTVDQDKMLISFDEMMEFIDACAKEMHEKYFRTYR